MEVKKFLEELRTNYLSTELPHALEKSGWEELNEVLTREEHRQFPHIAILFRPTVTFALGIAVVSSLLLFSIPAIEGALPGEPVYPIKRFSENLIVMVSGNKHIKVHNRFEEIVSLTKQEKDFELLEQTVQEYKQTIVDTKKELRGREERGNRGGIELVRERLKEELERQVQVFTEVIESSPSSNVREELQEAIEAAKGEGEEGD